MRDHVLNLQIFIITLTVCCSSLLSSATFSWVVVVSAGFSLGVCKESIGVSRILHLPKESTATDGEVLRGKGAKAFVLT